MSDKNGTQPSQKRRQSINAVPRWKHWHFKSSFLLMAAGALAIILYLSRSVIPPQFEGMGAALCAIACAGFLVWHIIHLMADQDRVEELEEQKLMNKALDSTRETNPDELKNR